MFFRVSWPLSVADAKFKSLIGSQTIFLSVSIENYFPWNQGFNLRHWIVPDNTGRYVGEYRYRRSKFPIHIG